MVTGDTSWERMGSDSSLSTTLPAPSVDGPPTNSITRAAQEPAGSAAPVRHAATCTRMPPRQPRLPRERPHKQRPPPGPALADVPHGCKLRHWIIVKAAPED